MTFETRQAYSEVCAVLEYMPDEYVKKIPSKIIKLFQQEKLADYEVNINKSNPLDKNYLSKKTMVLIAMLNYQYWCPNKQQKDVLYKQYLANNEKYEKEVEEKYNVDNIFKNKQEEKQQLYEETNNMQLVEYKESFIKKLINKIKRFFRR